MGLISNIKKVKKRFFTSTKDLGSAGINALLRCPVYITTPEAVHMDENAVLRLGTVIVNGYDEHVFIGRYSVVGMNVTMITNNHRSTVGIPQCLLGVSHINDKSEDLHIKEDVWVGQNATLLAGANLGRGCIVGACSTVTKPVPPYALVVGSPARIVGVKFTIDQIIEHEKALYPKSERMSREQLEELFAKYYEGKSVFGIQRELTEEELEELERCKKSRRYVEPNLDD